MNLQLVGIKPLVGIDLLHSSSGITADPTEVRERCDCCHKEVLASNIYFDGERFLCQPCKRDSTSAHPATASTSSPDLQPDV